MGLPVMRTMREAIVCLLEIRLIKILIVLCRALSVVGIVETHGSRHLYVLDAGVISVRRAFGPAGDHSI